MIEQLKYCGRWFYICSLGALSCVIGSGACLAVKDWRWLAFGAVSIVLNISGANHEWKQAGKKLAAYKQRMEYLRR
jgi:hypothetical protein